MSASSTVPLIERLRELYVNLEQYSHEEIRSILSEAINNLRDAEHVRMRDRVEEIAATKQDNSN